MIDLIPGIKGTIHLGPIHNLPNTEAVPPQIVKGVHGESNYTPVENRSNCIHCDGFTLEVAEVRNCSCGERMQRIWQCELFGKCLPLARPESVVVRTELIKCSQCEKYVADTEFHTWLADSLQD